MLDDELELSQVVEFIQRRKSIIIIIAVFALISALALAYRQKPLYQSSATLLLKQKDLGLSTLFGNLLNQVSGQSEKSLQTTVKLLTVWPTLEAVIKKLRLKMTTEELASKIETKAEPDTNMITVSVTDASGFRAQRIAQALVEEYLNQSKKTAVNELTRAREEVFQKLKDTETEIIALANETAKRSKVPDDLKAKLDMATGLYVMLAEKHEQLKIYEELQTSEAVLVSPPFVPSQPISPKPIRNGTIALISGLFVGLLVAAGVEMLDNTVKTTEEAEKLLQLPVIGQIPLDRQFQKGTEDKVVIKVKAKSGIAEAFRSLRTNLEYINVNKNIKTILVTSANPDEGKSFSALNIASSFAEAGKKVILISADLRKPTLHDYLGIANNKGLSAYLVGYLKTPEEIIHRTSAPRLFFVPSGPQPPNPAELLETPLMEQAMAAIKEKADFVFIDTPPLLRVADAAILFRYADAAMLVLDYTKTTKQAVKQVQNYLRKLDVRKIGVIFNKTPLNGSYYGYYGQEYSRRSRNS